MCYIHCSGEAESPTEWPTAPQLDCGCGCLDGGSRTSPEKPGIVFKEIREAPTQHINSTENFV